MRAVRVAVTNERPSVTLALRDSVDTISAAVGVYRPQEDSRLLIEAVERTTVVVDCRVADVCTGSGVVAVAAAKLGARSVTAWDISPDAVRCARSNADGAGVSVDVRQGSLHDALDDGPYDVLLCNPPYVPTSPATDGLLSGADPVCSWDGGRDGRAIVDPLCKLAWDLLVPGGTLVLVQSEFSGVDDSLESLRSNGLTAEVVAWQRIPFGPVLTAQADWLERIGRLESGRREEELVVIRAGKP